MANSDADLAQAIHAFFDRLPGGLPHFVSIMPSLYASILAALVILLLGGRSVRQEYYKHANSDNKMLQFRWVVMLGVLLVVCNVVQSFVQRRVYILNMYKLNSQHFANVHWLAEYSRAARAGSTGLI